MNKAQELISQARRLDIRLSAHSNQLVIDAPKAVWTGELRQAFKKQKPNILKLLSAARLPRLSLFLVTLEEGKQMTAISPNFHEAKFFMLDMQKRFGGKRIKDVKLIRHLLK